MSSSVEDHVLGRIAAADIVASPFPHCIVDEVFPQAFYEDIIDHWPERDDFSRIGETGRVTGAAKYAERYVVPMTGAGLGGLPAVQARFWRDGVADWLLSSRMAVALVEKFRGSISPRFRSLETSQFSGDALLVSDRTNYSIGPHTDAPHRVVSLLFYLPEDAAFRRFGTSLYRPRKPGFRCPGGPHYLFESFERLETVEFLPNRLFIFVKSDTSFHGVEPVDLVDIERRLLIYNVRTPAQNLVDGSVGSAAG